MADDFFDQLLHAMQANLRPQDSRGLPILVSSAAISDLDQPDWDELTRVHPHVREAGLLVIPEQLWPDPTRPTYDMGAFFNA